MAKFAQAKAETPRASEGRTYACCKLRAAISEHLPEIIDAMVERAKTGDVAAATLLLGRVVPAVRPESPGQAIDDGGDMAARAESIVSATMNGTLSPTTASELMTVLAGQARIKDLVEIEQRLEALEARTQ